MSGKDEYKDIFNRPHHVSPKRPQMSRLNRAAQFSPFAALTGYDDLVAESARVTDQKIELGEDELTLLNEQLGYLQDHINEHPEVTVHYFDPDQYKDGGVYREYTGKIMKVLVYDEALVIESGLSIPFANILSIDRGK